MTVVGRAHLVAELLESLALGGRDLRGDGVEKRQGRQQVLTRRALTARVLTTGSTRPAGGFVVRQRVSASVSGPPIVTAPSGELPRSFRMVSDMAFTAS
jgi:hypothetical protein